MHNEHLYLIALTLIQGVGPMKAKSLLAHCGSAENVFREKSGALVKIPEIGPQIASNIAKKDVLDRAEKEIAYCLSNDIDMIGIHEKKYPDRLKQCEDGPILLYARGRMNLNAGICVSIVGTRKATSYGKGFCKELLSGIAHLQPLVISGLAYGIDICAHRVAISLGLETVGCVAHGLEKIYPPLHTSAAIEMMNHGGLLSEFPSHTRMTPELFPMRNRIIAGLADCTIIAETDSRGGSIITANIANSYGRDVFAVPGRIHDTHSAGCNDLIRKNIAAILSGPEDLIAYMDWGENRRKENQQLPLFQDLSEEENRIVRLLSQRKKLDIDELSMSTEISFTQLSGILLQLEFKGVIKSIPGKLYELG